jgi:hypothetical protein
MAKTDILRRLVAVFLLMLLLCASPAAAEPLAQGGCAGNVLANPGFEEGFSERSAGEVSIANGWFPWWQDGPGQEDGYYRRPEYKPEDASRYGMRRVRSGGFAQKQFNTFSTHNAGLLQQVQVPVDSILNLSAWVQVWSSQHHDPDSVKEPGNYRVYIGIDPTGGTDWNSPNLIWSEPAIQYNTWINLQLQAKAKAGTITVFLRGHPEFRTQFNDSYWDDICLTVQRPTPRPTNTPTITPTPTNSPTPTATPTPLPANICVSVYQDLNGNGQRDEGDSLVSGAVISLLDSSLVEVERYTTSGVSEPYCFQELVAGEYRVQRQNPSGYIPIEPDEQLAAVEPGTSMDIDFVADFVPTPTPTSTPTPTRTPTPTPTPEPIIDQVGSAIYSVSGIILAALALIVLVGLQALRKRQ